ncbi:hypothetical protein SEUCBS140593_009895 [Sporothrix eucalyptigena]|uniref:non-specific serine/threonine protein kinase n=1 Tax=Sporothrix eucalyptigena TaxID=1812306 RepID=A0ABP0CYP0_9PEZI
MALHRIVCRHPSRFWRMPFSSPFSSLAARLGPVQSPRSAPRSLPTTGFDVVAREQLVEEEAMHKYRAKHFYPECFSEVFHDRYQTVAKLGHGSSSTIWLARSGLCAACKIIAGTPAPSPPEGFWISFQVAGPHAVHMVLVLQASQMTVRDMDIVFMNCRGFDKGFVNGTIEELPEALDFLLSERRDVHPGYLLLGTDNDAHVSEAGGGRFRNFVPRKQLNDRTIYLSCLMKPQVGPLLVSDFGEARLRPGPHAGDIMTIVYRAPETLLHIQWSYPVDIWSVGLTAWDLPQGRTLFSARKDKDDDGSFADGAHLPKLIAALGPPP